METLTTKRLGDTADFAVFAHGEDIGTISKTNGRWFAVDADLNGRTYATERAACVRVYLTWRVKQRRRADLEAFVAAAAAK